MQLTRVERRQIEDEIANRILSDISEENSIAGSMASTEEMMLMTRFGKNGLPLKHYTQAQSGESTPIQADFSSTGNTTPLASPAFANTDSLSIIERFFGATGNEVSSTFLFKKHVTKSLFLKDTSF